MIKHIIFDLDGVLVSTKEIHFHALNKALPKRYKISLEDHFIFYDGLPTKKKIEILHKKRNLPKNLIKNIILLKDKETFSIIKKRSKKI